MSDQPSQLDRCRLDRMTPSEAEEYLGRSTPVYIEERARAGDMPLAQAASEAAEQHARALPQGVRTAGHSFFRICDRSSGQPVGAAWLFVDAARREAFLYDIVIEEGQRRQGYGRSAMHLLAQVAKAAGCRHFRLHVWGHNEAAIKFYRSLGMTTTDVHMSQRLG